MDVTVYVFLADTSFVIDMSFRYVKMSSIDMICTYVTSANAVHIFDSMGSKKRCMGGRWV